jgi:hypothetical protein
VFMCSVKCDAQYIQKQRKVCTMAQTVKQRCNYAVGGAKHSNTKEVVILLSRRLIGITQPTELCHTQVPLLCCEQQATLMSSLAHQPPVTQHRSSKRVQTRSLTLNQLLLQHGPNKKNATHKTTNGR